MLLCWTIPITDKCARETLRYILARYTLPPTLPLDVLWLYTYTFSTMCSRVMCKRFARTITGIRREWRYAMPATTCSSSQCKCLRQFRTPSWSRTTLTTDKCVREKLRYSRCVALSHLISDLSSPKRFARTIAGVPWWAAVQHARYNLPFSFVTVAVSLSRKKPTVHNKSQLWKRNTGEQQSCIGQICQRHTRISFRCDVLLHQH